MFVFVSCGLQLSSEVMKYHAIMEEKRKERAIKTAGVIAGMVREFWTSMTEVRFYSCFYLKVEWLTCLIYLLTVLTITSQYYTIKQPVACITKQLVKETSVYVVSFNCNIQLKFI